MSESIKAWAEQIRAGDVRAVSRAITAIEDRDPQAEILSRMRRLGMAVRTCSLSTEIGSSRFLTRPALITRVQIGLP